MRLTRIVSKKERDTLMPCETKVETGQTDRQIDRQTDRNTDRQTDKNTERQEYIEIKKKENAESEREIHVHNLYI